MDPSFPLRLWDQLNSQCTTTLNLLRPSNINLRLSTEAQLNGAFDYNKTPMALPGTKVLVHETPLTKKTFVPHAVDGWYIGLAPKHYRIFWVYIPKTREERIARSVDSPHNSTISSVTSADTATIAATNLIYALINPVPTVPFTPPEGEKRMALKQLASIFSSVAPFVQNSKANTLKTRLPPETSEGASAKGPLRYPPTPKKSLCKYYLAQNINWYFGCPRA